MQIKQIFAKSAKPKNNLGFSLVEIMIVVAVIAILAALAIPMYTDYIDTSKRSVPENVIEQFPLLLETFRAENGQFPPNGTYTYTETDTGTISDNIGGVGTNQAGLVGFSPRSRTYPTDTGLPYHYTLQIANAGSTGETATFWATPQTDRDAPAGNVPNPAATYQ